MAYNPQYWTDYDQSMTETQNVENGAVVTAERMNNIEKGISSNSKEIKEKRDKDVTISMSDLSADVIAEIGKDKTSIVEGQSVGMSNFVKKIQEDIGEYYDVAYKNSIGGWTVEGKKDDSDYAKKNYLRTEIDGGYGEIIRFELDLKSMKRFVFIDSEGKVISYFDTLESKIEFSCPFKSRKVRIQFYEAGSIFPIIKRLTYTGIAGKKYTNELLFEAKEDFYYKGELGGQRILNQNLSEQFQLDTGKEVELPLIWESGGWNKNGTENNSSYAKDNYVRAEYRIQKQQTGRPLKLVGKWSTALEIVRTFDEFGIMLQELTSLNQSEIVFSIDNKTRSVKVQSYKSSVVHLSHYVYNSTASKDYVNEALNRISGNSLVFKEDDNVKIVYHRGWNKNSPEQTKFAFVEAKKRGAIWVECDVLLTKDNVPVIHHDDTINRTARNDDGSKISEQLKVNDLTLEEIKKYDFGIAWGEEFKGERILTLEEFLKLCYQLSLKARLEIKQTPSPTYLQHFGEVLEKSPMVNKVELCSASTYDMNLIKNRFTKHDLILVGGNANDENLTFVKNLENAGRIISFGLMVENIDKNDNMSKILSYGIKYEFWTVDSKYNLDRCLEYYPIGITTNNLDYYETLLG